MVVALADENQRREYAAHLVANGFAAAASTTGEALGLASRLVPEIVVLELDASGLAAAHRIREQATTQGTGTGIVGLSPRSMVGRLDPQALAAFDVVLEVPCSAVTLLTELLVMLAQLSPDGA